MDVSDWSGRGIKEAARLMKDSEQCPQENGIGFPVSMLFTNHMIVVILY